MTLRNHPRLLGVAAALLAAWSLLTQLDASPDATTNPGDAPPPTVDAVEPCDGPLHPSACRPADGDRHGRLLHARWVAAFTRAREARERLERCRAARAASKDEDCPLESLERTHERACGEVERARAAYLGHARR